MNVIKKLATAKAGTKVVEKTVELLGTGEVVERIAEVATIKDVLETPEVPEAPEVPAELESPAEPILDFEPGPKPTSALVPY